MAVLIASSNCFRWVEITIAFFKLKSLALYISSNFVSKQGGNVKHRFVRRGFSQCTWEELPERRRVQINLARGSKYYVKMVHEADISSADNNSHGSYALDLPQ